MSDTHREMMNVAEAAAYLGWAENTLRKVMRTTDIPHRRLGPRLVLFSRSALDAWAAGQGGAQTGAPTPPAAPRPFMRVDGKIPVRGAGW